MDFIKRDIPRWQTYELPEETNDWYNIYCDLREQTERSLDADAEIMKKAIDGINNKRAALTPQIIPQSKGRYLAHGRPAKKKNSIFQPVKRNNALAVPTKALNSRASQVQRAPRALVEEHQEARRPAQPKVNAPKRSSLPPSLQHPMLAKNEDKLRALTSSAPRADPTPDLKRQATSPPLPPSPAPASSQPSGPSTSGPVMRRRPPPSVFMPSKRRRV